MDKKTDNAIQHPSTFFLSIKSSSASYTKTLHHIIFSVPTRQFWVRRDLKHCIGIFSKASNNLHNFQEQASEKSEEGFT